MANECALSPPSLPPPGGGETTDGGSQGANTAYRDPTEATGGRPNTSTCVLVGGTATPSEGGVRVGLPPGGNVIGDSASAAQLRADPDDPEGTQLELETSRSSQGDPAVANEQVGGGSPSPTAVSKPAPSAKSPRSTSQEPGAMPSVTPTKMFTALV